MGTGIQETQRSHDDQHQRWERLERADLFERDGALHTPGLSQRQAAKGRAVPRSTLQAWRADQERLDAWPAVVAFFHRVPGLACLHRLVLALHLVCPAVGAWGICLGCLWLTMTGRHRFVGASYGPQQQGNRRVAAALVASRHAERAAGARDAPHRDHDDAG